MNIVIKMFNYKIRLLFFGCFMLPGFALRCYTCNYNNYGELGDDGNSSCVGPNLPSEFLIECGVNDTQCATAFSVLAISGAAGSLLNRTCTSNQNGSCVENENGYSCLEICTTDGCNNQTQKIKLLPTLPPKSEGHSVTTVLPPEDADGGNGGCRPTPMRGILTAIFISSLATRIFT